VVGTDEVFLSKTGVAGTFGPYMGSGDLTLTSGFTLIGAQAGNYSLSGQPTVSASITKPDMPPGIEDMTIPVGTIVGPDGTITYPDDEGGTITLTDDTVIDAPGGSVTDPNGAVAFPDTGGGTITLPDDTVIDAPGGTLIDTGNGQISFPGGGGGTIACPDYDEIFFPGGAVINLVDGTVTFPDGGGGAITCPLNGIFYIIAKAGTGGGITPSGAIPVRLWNNQAFTIEADDGYRISGVIVDGESVGEVSSYTFDSVIKAHTIEAEFTIIIGEDGEDDENDVNVESSRGGGGGGGGMTFYTVTFDTDGGSAVQNQGVARNGKIMKPADPVKDGFDFGGWYSDKELKTEYNFNRAVTGNITLYAKWEATLNERPIPETGLTHPCDPYTDVDKSLWYHEFIDYVIENGIMQGTRSDKFEPDTTLSRAMMVQILYNMEGGPAAGGEAFDDVSQGEWYAAAIAWASSMKIVSGYGNGLFCPDKSITREEMVAILYRYANYKGYYTSAAAPLGAFGDAGGVSDWALPAMQWAVGAGLINGRSATRLAPSETATRAEVATIITRFCKLFEIY